MDRLLSVKDDAAAQLSCSEAAVRKWLHQGRLQCVKIGRLTPIRHQGLDALIGLGLSTESVKAKGGLR